MIRTHYFFSKDNIPEKPKPVERDYRGVKFDVGNFVAYNKSGSVRLGKILNINKNEFVLKNKSTDYILKFEIIIQGDDGSISIVKNPNSIAII